MTREDCYIVVTAFLEGVIGEAQTIVGTILGL
jgi:hypothetical protein